MATLFSSSGDVINTRRNTSRGRSLTRDGLKSLSSDSPTLFLEEVVKPLTCFVDIMDPEKVLYPFDYVALSKITHKRGRTYANVVSPAFGPQGRA